MRFVTLGVGAMNSPCHAPAGLLISCSGARVVIDGGPGAVPDGRVDAWLMTDDRAELIGPIRKLARERGLVPRVGDFQKDALRVEVRRVVHTSHPTYGYRVRAQGRTVVWAPEFFEFPRWAHRADLMFAEASAWRCPIRFRGGVGGHMDVLAVAQEAKRLGVRRLVFAHIGRPTLRALARGLKPPFGEVAADGQTFVIGPRRNN